MIGNRAGQVVGVKRNATGHEIRGKLRDTQAMLRVMAMNLVDNNEALPEDQLKELKESVLKAYEELVVCDLKAEWMDGALHDALERHKDACTSTPDFSLEQFYNMVESDLQQQQQQQQRDLARNALSATNTEQYQQLKMLLFPQSSQDAELEVMGEGNREAAYMCPVTRTRMMIPMKCSDKRCIHRISQEGFNLMMARKNRFKCPVVGCSVEWVKGGSQVDDDFRLEIEHYYKDKQLQNRALVGMTGGSSSSSSGNYASHAGRVQS